MNPIRKAAICLVLLSSAATAYAEAGHWRLDPVHTRVLFRVDHAGFSQALGVFPDIRGELRFDPEDWRDATLEVRVPLAGLQIGDEAWRDKLLSRTWLHAGEQAEAVFRSTRVEPLEAGRARVHGTLSLRGETAPVVLDVRLNKHARNPLTFRETAGFSASAALDRRDLGMAEWPNVVGQRVELEIQAEAIRYTPTDKERADADAQHD